MVHAVLKRVVKYGVVYIIATVFIAFNTALINMSRIFNNCQGNMLLM